MSDDDSTNTPATRDRRDAVREKAELVRAKQSRNRLIRRSALITGLVAAVAVVGVVVAWTVTSTVNRPQLQPANTSGDGFAVTSLSSAAQSMTSLDQAPAATTEPTEGAEVQGDEAATPAATAAPVEIHVYVDYLSPGAREWQLANSPQLSSWVSEGAVTLTYHPVSMLTAKSNGTKYSLRAAAAAACVATYSSDVFFKFNNELLTRQPAVDSDGFSNTELASMAIASGSDNPKKLRDCIETEAFSAWVKAATERAIGSIPGADGLSLTGTPMVVVNGQQYVGQMADPAEFSQFVLTSASGAFRKSQEATPTPTPSPTP